MISRIIWDGARNLKELVKESVEMLREGFGREYRQVAEVRDGLNMALKLASSHNVSCSEAMEHLRCTTVPEILAGAVYTALCYENNFDEAMITAVNHSGHSAAVGAVTGAILGARLGEEAIPDFYLEPLGTVDLLRELADDMHQGCPMELGNGLFDDDWDRKYIHGGI